MDKGTWKHAQVESHFHIAIWRHFRLLIKPRPPEPHSKDDNDDQTRAKWPDFAIGLL